MLGCECRGENETHIQPLVKLHLLRSGFGLLPNIFLVKSTSLWFSITLSLSVSLFLSLSFSLFLTLHSCLFPCHSVCICFSFSSLWLCFFSLLSFHLLLSSPPFPPPLLLLLHPPSPHLSPSFSFISMCGLFLSVSVSASFCVCLWVFLVCLSLALFFSGIHRGSLGTILLLERSSGLLN